MRSARLIVCGSEVSREPRNEGMFIMFSTHAVSGLEISGCTGARCTQKFGCAPKFLKLGARRAPSNFNTVIVDRAYNKKHLKLNVFKTLSIHDFQPTPIRFKSVYL